MSLLYFNFKKGNLPMKQRFRMPTPVKITGRTSSITNAFVNGIIPVIQPTEQEIEDALKTLGMDSNHIVYAYCGDTYTEWDHFHPLIKDKMPTGYISEIHNLVPACGKCNQSKGNKHWKTWMLSNAELSPFSRRIPDIEHRIKRLENYERQYTPIRLDFEKIVGKDMWQQHWTNCQALRALMQESQKHSDKLKAIIHNAISQEKNHEEFSTE